MDLLILINQFNHFLDVPTTFLFLGVGIYLTIRNGFLQFRGMPRFWKLITKGVGEEKTKLKTISPFQALFTAMSTTIGIGNVVGPIFAIVMGGPGALFWLLAYAFFGAATKFTEVVFAIHYRTQTKDNKILGGPAEYLKAVHPFLAHWYGLATMLLFAGWAGIQATILGELYAYHGVPTWLTGAVLAGLVFAILSGGAQRVSTLASKLVPIMFTVYVSFALWILLSDIGALKHAFGLMFSHIFTPAAAVGGFMGATLFAAIRAGTYKSVFITESGVGTSAIPHSLADTKIPTDQGLLALFSVTADAFLCLLSGLMILASGLWTTGQYSSLLIYSIFANHWPIVGPFVFLFSVSLFIISTAIGNGFNGSISFATITKYRWMLAYNAFVGVVCFFSALAKVQLVWEMMDLLLPLVAIPNLVGLIILTVRQPQILKIKK